MLRIFLIVFLSIWSAMAVAQDRPNTILVLDASGSMWGQIDGAAKITIAQDVIAGLVESLPNDQVLGLTVYGHRRKGDCSDIETLIMPAPGTRQSIIQSVNAIKPKGKTPMTDAVIAAANDLRFTEEKATVILVSDGVETCNPDPCAAARLLEESGVDFTAHVVGFSISDPKAITQMTCLAHETGGTFRTASNAAELTAALSVVSEPAPAPEPVVVPVQIVLRAQDGKHGDFINNDLVWNLTSEDGGVVVENQISSGMTLELTPGIYIAEVLRPLDETTAQARVVVGRVSDIVTLVLPQYRPPATLMAPDSAPVSSKVTIRWTGPDAKQDFVSITHPDARSSNHITYEYTNRGIELQITMPPEPGMYEIRYILSDGRKVLATRMIEATPVGVTLTAKDQATAGADLLVEWDGPDYQGDFIAVALPDQRPTAHINYTYTKKGSPLKLSMPTEPGEYEVRYISGPGRQILGHRMVTVGELATTLEAIESAPIGASIDVTWTGGDYKNDFIAVAEPDARGSSYLNYTYTKKGSPLKVTMPLVPGDYELRYVLGQDRAIAASRTITITPLEVSVDAPASAVAGSMVNIEWGGPDYRNNYVAISEIGSRPTSHLSYTYTKKGSPLKVQVPSEPGAYEIRYVAKGSPDRVLANTPLSVTQVSATLSAPDTATAGGTLDVTWQGPDYPRDFIGIAIPGKKGHTDYTYTKKGSPLVLKLPDEPGLYELNYYLGSDRAIIATRMITLE